MIKKFQIIANAFPILYYFGCAAKKSRTSTMKKMTCKQLGGACDLEFKAKTFEEIAQMSKNHGVEMFQIGDKPHLKAMEAMRELMHSPEAMKNWFDSKRAEFNELPDE